MAVEQADIIVVGGGVSGLTAAYEIIKHRPDLNIVVLEALDRVGGRTLSVPLETPIGPKRWDVGGQWVGTTQTHVMNLLKELKLKTYPQYITGFNMVQFEPDGLIQKYKGDIPGSVTGGMDVLNLCRKLQKMSRQVSPNDPFKDKNSQEWNKMSLKDWLQNEAYTQEGRDAIDMIVGSTMDTTTDKLSLLFFLMYLNSAGSDFEIWTGEKDDGAQAYKIENGAQSISDQLVAKLPENTIYFNQTVTRISNETDSVVVQTDSGEIFQAQRIILAIPPIQISNITFEPQLSDQKQSLLAGIYPKGAGYKFVFTYSKAFWREKKLSGQIIAVPVTDPDTGKELPDLATYDANSADGAPALIGFADNLEANLTKEDRKELYLKQLVRFYGKKAREIVDFTDQNWSTEPYAKGAVASAEPEVLSADYPILIKEPTGRIHWAGTETATVWMGYINGAVQSGQRAADEILDSGIKHINGADLSVIDFKLLTICFLCFCANIWV